MQKKRVHAAKHHIPHKGETLEGVIDWLSLHLGIGMVAEHSLQAGCQFIHAIKHPDKLKSSFSSWKEGSLSFSEALQTQETLGLTLF